MGPMTWSHAVFSKKKKRTDVDMFHTSFLLPPAEIEALTAKLENATAANEYLTVENKYLAAKVENLTADSAGTYY